jgi:hypothetical protein
VLGGHTRKQLLSNEKRNFKLLSRAVSLLLGNALKMAAKLLSSAWLFEHAWMLLTLLLLGRLTCSLLADH